MKSRRLIIFGVASYMVFLVASFPASLAYSWFYAGSPADKQVMLGQLDGPWWSGKANFARIGRMEFNELAWRFRPLALLLGKLSVRLTAKADDGYFKGIIGVGLHTVTFDKTECRLPLALFDEAVGLYGVQAKGLVSSTISSAYISKGRLLEADGRLAANGIELISPQALRLGDFNGSVSTEKEGVRLTFSDNGGPLKAEGVFLAAKDGSYSFSGTFLAVDKQQPTLADLVSLLGKPDDQGLVTVTSSGTMPAVSF